MIENTAFFGSLTQNAAVPMPPSITMIEQRRMLNERVRLHVGDEQGDVVDAGDPHPALVHRNPRPPERRLKSSRIA